jgi:2-amino-4-hydroxy-6-hydroxymethyldihydropteridine diphosphokinase
MIFIGLGSNITSRLGNSSITILRALDALERRGVRVLRRSHLYRTSPHGLANQPDFINAVAAISTALTADALLALAKQIEAIAGRVPSGKWGPRALDIDILDYNRQILNWSKHKEQFSKYNRFSLILPHPEIASRAFVLKPLLDVAPRWHHPVTGLGAAQLLKRLQFTKAGKIIDSIEDNLL